MQLFSNNKILRKLFFSSLILFFYGTPTKSVFANTTNANPQGGGSNTASFGQGSGTISGIEIKGEGLDGILNSIFEISVTLTIVLAVIMLTIGGVQYMGSESMFAKDDGRKRMMAAIGGLLIAVLSIFILNIILGTGEGGGPFDAGSSFELKYER